MTREGLIEFRQPPVLAQAFVCYRPHPDPCQFAWQWGRWCSASDHREQASSKVRDAVFLAAGVEDGPEAAFAATSHAQRFSCWSSASMCGAWLSDEEWFLLDVVQVSET